MKPIVLIFTCFLLLFSTTGTDLYAQCSNIVLEGQPAVNTFATDYPDCTQKADALYIVGDVTDISPLSTLDTINDFGIYGTVALADLSPLAGLDYVERFELIDNAGINSLSALQNLTVGQQVYFVRNPNLVTCDVDFVCDLIAADLSVSIGSNGSDCNEYLDVYNACLGTNCSTGDITLNSQAAVDNYATETGNCPIVRGNLIISGSDITDLSALASIEQVMGQLTIRNNASLVSLDNVFPNLQSVSGEFKITSNGQLAQISGFDQLENVYDKFRIEFNGQLATINGFNQLETVEAFSLRNLNLTSCPEFPELKSVDDFFQLRQAGSFTDLSGFSVLEHTGKTWLVDIPITNVSGLSSLVSSGELSIENCMLSDLADFSSSLNVSLLQLISNSLLTDINGLQGLTNTAIRFKGNPVFAPSSNFGSTINIREVTIEDNPAIQDMGLFANVTSFSDRVNITITNNDQLQTLDGLEGVVSSNNVTITNNAVLTTTDGLQNLSYATPESTVNRSSGNITITDNPSLTSLGFTSLIECADINIQRNQGLSQIIATDFPILREYYTWRINNNNSLISIGSVGSLSDGIRLIISDNPALEQITFINVVYSSLEVEGNPQLREITEITGFNPGDIEIFDNQMLETIGDVSSFQRLFGDLKIFYNPKLRHIGDFSSLTRVGNLEIYRLDSITNLSGLESLERAGGVYLEYLTSVTSFSDLENLRQVSTLTIANNPLLNDLTGFPTDLVVSNSLSIEDNPALSACNIIPFCEYLSGSGSANIRSNAVGCNTTGEVINACGIPANCSRDYTADGQAQVDDVANVFSGCSVIDGRVRIQGNFSNADAFSGITAILGGLIIDGSNTSGPVNLNGLSNITSVGNVLTISDLPDLSSTTAGMQIDSINSLYVGEIGSGADLLPEVEWVNNITFESNHDSPATLGNLTTIAGDLVVNSSSLKNFSFFTSLDSIAGDVNIQFSNIETLAGLEQVRSVERIRLASCPKLIDLNGLNPNGLIVKGGVSIFRNRRLLDLTGLTNISSMRSLSISDNTAIRSFMGLETMIFPTDALYIVNNPNLITLNGFGDGLPMPPLLEISNNARLGYCHSDWVCTYISSNSGTMVAYGNACGGEPIIAAECNLLPVTWNYFEVYHGGKSADLKWATGTEINNREFMVERSADGRNWITLATITPDESQVYTYKDAAPQVGINYYRIRQIDYDRSEAYSEVRTLMFSEQQGSLAVYPNPVERQSIWRIQGVSDADEGHCTLINNSGQVVRSNWSEGNIDVVNLPSGIYTLRIVVKQQVFSTKLVVQH